MITSYRMNTVSAAVTPPFQSTASWSTTSMWCTNLDWSWVPSGSPTCVDHRLQLRTIMASKCIIKLTSSWYSISPLARSPWGDTMEQTESQPISNAPLHLSQHPKGICEPELFWFQDCRERNGCDSLSSCQGTIHIACICEGSTRVHEELHKLCISMKARQECMRNHTQCVDLLKLHKGECDQQLGKKECDYSCMMRWGLSTPGSPKPMLPVAQPIWLLPASPYAPLLLSPSPFSIDLQTPPHITQSMSIIPATLYAPSQLPPAKLSGSGGGEKWMCPPQWPQRAPLAPLWPPSLPPTSLDWHLQELLQWFSSIVWSLTHRMYT